MIFIIVHEENLARARLEAVVIATAKIQTVLRGSGVAGQRYCRDNISQFLESPKVPNEHPVHMMSNVKGEALCVKSALRPEFNDLI
jgi:hypothetical protein